MAKDTCFEGVTPENIDNCPNAESASGLSLRAQYIPAAFIETMVLPAKTGKLEEIVKIASGGITLKSDKKWKGIDLVMDENELKEVLVGGKGNQKGQVELTIQIPNFGLKPLGFKRRFANVPLVWNIPDSNGKNWIIGTKFSPAMIESAESTTGKAYEDKATNTFTIKANTYVYLYEGDIVEGEDA
ncbi:hypothetical protein EDL98_01325 [Ornithobacterium rhinotracheale]|uniref:hypothetical protein n=1 Tax=Ornithobacterium rhinotracheale TaxID=28251 RepID=UPI00129C1E61|nr:hypothetical protein [Ornithobacterium rhinotracheale]MRJ09733.1 hypothetical protein [Ornithobacterium rhinotracheale]